MNIVARLLNIQARLSNENSGHDARYRLDSAVRNLGKITAEINNEDTLLYNVLTFASKMHVTLKSNKNVKRKKGWSDVTQCNADKIAQLFVKNLLGADKGDNVIDMANYLMMFAFHGGEMRQLRKAVVAYLAVNGGLGIGTFHKEAIVDNLFDNSLTTVYVAITTYNQGGDDEQETDSARRLYSWANHEKAVNEMPFLWPVEARKFLAEGQYSMVHQDDGLRRDFERITREDYHEALME